MVRDFQNQGRNAALERGSFEQGCVSPPGADKEICGRCSCPGAEGGERLIAHHHLEN